MPLNGKNRCWVCKIQKGEVEQIDSRVSLHSETSTFQSQTNHCVIPDQLWKSGRSKNSKSKTAQICTDVRIPCVTKKKGLLVTQKSGGSTVGCRGYQWKLPMHRHFGHITYIKRMTWKRRWRLQNRIELWKHQTCFYQLSYQSEEF